MYTKFEERESVILKSHGLKLFGVLHRPLIKEKFPGVLICHGLDGTKVSHFRFYVILAEQLAQNGIATLRLDFRGAGDSEGHFEDISISGKVEDALLALDYLAKDKGIDVKRMGIIGRSLGGAVAVKVANNYSDIKSMVLMSPLFGRPGGFQMEAKHFEKAEEELSKRIYELTTSRPSKILVKELLNLNLDKEVRSLNHIPLLHIHGLLDQVVTVEQADFYENSRKNASGKTKFIKLEKSAHEYIDIHERKKIIDETVSWLKNTL